MKNTITTTFTADRAYYTTSITDKHSATSNLSKNDFLKVVMENLVSEAGQARFSELLEVNAKYTHDTPENLALIDLIEEVSENVRKANYSQVKSLDTLEEERQRQRNTFAIAQGLKSF